MPVLTRWQVLNYEKSGPLKPERIKKVRNPKGVASYEIIWGDSDGIFKGLNDEKDAEKLLSTIEPQELVGKAYPDLVETFKQSKIKPKQRKASKRKKAGKAVEDVEKMLQNVSISEPKPKRKVKTIDSYFKQALVNNLQKNSSTPVKASIGSANDSFLFLNASAFEDDCDDAELSDIVREIVAQKPLLGEVMQKNSPFSFFMEEPTEDDVFEQTFNELCCRNSEGAETSEEETEDEDSFVISELPLIERLKNKRM